jgi:predicted RNA methylase
MVSGFLEGTGISTGDGILVLIEIRSSRRVVAIEKDSIYFRVGINYHLSLIERRICDCQANEYKYH